MKKIFITPLFFTIALFSVAEISLAQLTQLTDIPTIYITTNGGVPIDSKEVYVPGTLTVVAADGVPGKYAGPIEIRGRGNSTWFFPKKPYRIKLDSKTNLLGMPSKEKKWVLLANYRENTLIRNSLAFEISKRVGSSYSCPYRFVDVFLNGSYIGNYTLTDLVEVGDHRVLVEKLDNTVTTEPDLTGGYFIQTESYAEEEDINFQTPQAHRIAIKYPDEEDINQEQINYIKNHVIEFENRLFSPQFLDPVSGYKPYIDRDSQVKWYIACELTGNSDSFTSVFMYKKRNDPKIYFGPLWDYDIAFNNNPNLGDATYKRMSVEAYNTGWINRMLQDPEFKAAVKTKWNELITNGLNDFIENMIDEQSQQLLQSQAQNFQIWPYYTPNGRLAANEVYVGYISELQSYMRKRIAYLDQQFNDHIRPDMYYKLANRSTAKVIAPNSSADVNLVQKSATADILFQQWSFISVVVNGTTYYRIKNRETNQYLSAYNNNVFAQLRTTSDAVNDYQLWEPIPAENNTYYGFLNKGSGLAIENLDNQNSENNNIIQLSNQISSQSKQQWTLIPFEINDNPLPISISNLKARSEEGNVHLTWNVEFSKNGSHIIIERTIAPGRILPDSIGKVELTDLPSGEYEFIDYAPNSGINYYRLKKVDADGSSSLSPYVSINLDEIYSLNVFPVPAQEFLDISFFSNSFQGSGKLNLLNQSGSQVRSFVVEVQKGNNEQRLNTRNLSSGIYHLQFEKEGQVIVKKILVLPK